MWRETIELKGMIPEGPTNQYTHTKLTHFAVCTEQSNTEK